MSSITMARYRMRALLTASSIGLLIGASAGAAYLGGRLAQDATADARSARLMQMAELNGDMTPSAALGAKPLNATAFDIATRFAPYGGMSGDQNARADQSLTAMRISEDVRSQKGSLIRDVQTVATTALRTTPLFADHPVRPAAAMVFKQASQNDSDCLTQAVYYEARGEGVDGMRAVAQVILNRVRHPAYPKSICGVVYQGANRRVSCQFSFVCNGSMGRPVEAYGWRRARDVAGAALEGYVMKSVGTATHFHTTYVDPRWAGNMVQVATVGDHVFYQFRGRNARINTDIDAVNPSDAPQMAQADTAQVTNDASDALNAGQVTTAQTAAGQAATGHAKPAVPSMTPSTVAPTGEARAQLISALNKAEAGTAKAVQVKSVITGKTAQEITAEVAINPTGVSH